MELELVLTPKRLGTMKVKIKLSDKNTIIAIKTDNAATASLLSEQESRLSQMFDEAGLKFSVGQYPGRLTTGDTYTIKQALVYEYESGKSVQATFTFDIEIE